MDSDDILYGHIGAHNQQQKEEVAISSFEERVMQIIIVKQEALSSEDVLEELNYDNETPQGEINFYKTAYALQKLARLGLLQQLETHPATYCAAKDLRHMRTK